MLLGIIKHTILVVVAITTFLPALKVTTSSSQNLLCNFDEIQSKIAVGKNTKVKYVQHKSGSRPKRTPDDLYEPIRIGVFVHDLDDSMYVDNVEFERLERVTKGAVSIIEKLLSVIPVSGPLLLSRSEEACLTKHRDGPYQGRCSAKLHSYVGDKCLDFTIPDEHLGGFWVWDDASLTTGQPREYYKNGSGIQNTDTVLYVTKQHTKKCASSHEIVAYALYCKLDQNNRPIAGVINFCPNHLQDEIYDEDKFILLAVHEIFHILGFSCTLFGKFKDCSFTDSNTGCPNFNLVVTHDSHNQPRLITPTVIEVASQLFGCADPEYQGGPLEERATAKCSYSSHWESRFMSGSIMAPTIGKPHQTFLDRLTLAVFEDSGWYKVNYDYAEDLLWGKGQGCYFGETERCTTEASELFCNTSSASGCNYLHRDKGTCSTNDFLDECSTFLPVNLGQCSVNASEQPATVDGEMFHPDSRCYVTNLSPKGHAPCNPIGRCYLTRCNETSVLYQIRVGDGPWTLCQPGTDISIPGHDGKVTCPSFERICGNKSSILDLVDPCCPTTPSAPSSTSFSRTTVPLTSERQSLFVSMGFRELEYAWVADQEQQSAFKMAVRKTVCETTNIMKNRVTMLHVGEDQMEVTVAFAINKAGLDMNSEVISVQKAYQELKIVVFNMTFRVPYMGELYTATSISIKVRGETFLLMFVKRNSPISNVLDEITSPPPYVGVSLRYANCEMWQRERIIKSQPPTTAHFTQAYGTNHVTIGMPVAIILWVIMLGILMAYICCRKKERNAVGPSLEDITEMQASPRSPGIYIVSEASCSSREGQDATGKS